VGAAVSTAAGDHIDVVVTKDWNPLEPEVIEHKWYAPGIGMVREETVAGGHGSVELIEHRRGVAG
jgi:hypothetical protein